MASTPSRKAADDPDRRSTHNAVDRASSATPLDDDSHIDPATIRDRVRARQSEGRAEPDNPQKGPGPVPAEPNRSREKGHRDTPTESPAVRRTIDETPRERAKDRLRDETSDGS